jgi:sulfite reductase alpha subunit
MTDATKGKSAKKDMPETPMLDELEGGVWPSFVSNLKRLAEAEDKPYAGMMKDLLGQLEHSYETRKGYWKGGTVGVRGYGAGIIPRFSEVRDEYPESSEFHTLRVQPPAGMHYDTATLRKICDIWEKYGSGLIALHGQSGDIMFQGISTENVQPCFDELNEAGFDLGGAGAGVRTSMSCVGAARCEQSCFNEQKAHRMIINSLLDDMHRPALPYKFKFKFSGCANDCVNAIHRSDLAVIGTWRDDMQVDQEEVKKAVKQRRSLPGLSALVRTVMRCMHCINVLTRALKPGKERGATILVGGKRSLKIGDLMGTVIVPFMKLETEEDYEKLMQLAHDCLEFWAENALDHERIGESIDRIGLPDFLEGIGLEVDPNMVAHPRTSSYVRMDDWDDEVAKWKQRKGAAADAAE